MYLSEILAGEEIITHHKSVTNVLSKNNFDYFVIKLDNETIKKSYALLAFNSNTEQFHFLCAGEKGSWMLNVVNDFDESFSIGDNVPVSDEIFDLAVDSGFHLISSPSGMIEFQKRLEDGFVYINNDKWHEVSLNSTSVSDSDWWISRWNNSNDNEKYVAIEERFTLSDALEKSELLVTLDMGTLPEQGFFKTTDVLKNSLVLEPKVVSVM